jgi:hypothetical protein
MQLWQPASTPGSLLVLRRGECTSMASRPSRYAIGSSSEPASRNPRVAGNTGGAARCSCWKVSRGQRLPARSNGAAGLRLKGSRRRGGRFALAGAQRPRSVRRLLRHGRSSPSIRAQSCRCSSAPEEIFGAVDAPAQPARAGVSPQSTRGVSSLLKSTSDAVASADAVPGSTGRDAVCFALSSNRAARISTHGLR